MAINSVKRPDLCVPYKHDLPPKSPFETNTGISNMVNQSMPMVAMFLRNKFIAWFALIQSFHYYLNADPEQASSSNNKNAMDQSPLVKIFLSIIGLGVCYMNIVLPQPDPLKFKAPATSEPTEQTTKD